MVQSLVQMQQGARHSGKKQNEGQCLLGLNRLNHLSRGWQYAWLGRPVRALQKPRVIFLDFVDFDDREKVDLSFQKIFADGYEEVEINALTKSGKKIPYLGSGKLLRIDGEEYLICSGTDISEINSRKKTEECNELLPAENIYFNENDKLSAKEFDVIGESDALKYALFRVEQVASTEASVLILGETGTGKELIAREIHKKSKRRRIR